MNEIGVSNLDEEAKKIVDKINQGEKLTEIMQLKVTLRSEDHGQTWFPMNVFYLSGSERVGSKLKPLDADPQTWVFERIGYVTERVQL